MAALKKIPFFLFLLALFFCLHGSVENYGYLNLYEVLKVGGIILLGIGVFFGLTWLLTKNYLLASLITFFVSGWYLFFGAIHDLIKSISFLGFMHSFTVLMPVLLVVNILVIWWLKKCKPLHPKMMQYLNVLFIIFCLADLGLLVNKHITYKEVSVPNPVPFDASKVTQKPNVYFMLFDEYAGYKSLQDSFGFKNDSLYNFLRLNNFTELPVFSNYDFTPFSMASILNMQYVPENYKKEALTQPDIQHRFGEIRNARVFTIFRSMDYKLQNLSIFDIKDYPALYEYNGLFPTHAGLLTNKIFHNRFLKSVGWNFVTGRFAIPGLKDYYMKKKDGYNKAVEENTLKSMTKKTAKPRFTYSHFFLPHGQFYRDSAGNFNPPEKILDLKYLADKSLYISYLKYTNNIIKKLVNQMNATDPNAIVVIMSDHGFYDYVFNGYDAYNFDNMAWVRFPAVLVLPDSANLPRSNVNFFRYFFNKGYGQNFSYLKDSTVYVNEDPDVLR